VCEKVKLIRGDPSNLRIKEGGAPQKRGFQKCLPLNQFEKESATKSDRNIQPQISNQHHNDEKSSMQFLTSLKFYKSF